MHELCRRLVLEALSHELGRRVKESEIVTTPAGKPRLRESDVTFNLSHSGTEALIGIGSGTEVGVDLESIRAVPEADALVAEYFTRSERETWMRQPLESRDRLLLYCWTRKEACLKAVGAGLSLPPATIETGPGPESVRVSIDVGTASGNIEVSSLTLPSGSAGAAAVFTIGSG